MTFGAIYVAFKYFGLDVNNLDVLRSELSAIRRDYGLHDKPPG